MKKAVCVAAVVLFSGCSALGPDYSAPDLNAPARFVGGASEGVRDASVVPWWHGFDDPALNQLVSIGLSQNLDIQAALERIVAARENTRRFGVAQQIDGNTSLDARRSRASTGTATDTTNLNVDAFYVFDIFGEYRRSAEQSLADLEAAQFDAGTVKLAYLAELVSSYVLVRYYQAAARITQDTIASRRNTLETARQRAEAQEGTQLEVAQARSLLATAEASLPILTAQARVNTFRIATLLNMPTGVLAQKLDQARAIPRPRMAMASGVPADLLRNRPDIRASERRLASATAAIGVSEAQLYPSLRLAGSVTAGDIDTWSFGPTLSIPMFDRTSRSAARNIALSDARQAEIAYRNTFITGIEEVQASLTLTDARQSQVTAYQQATSSADRVLNLARRSYEAGVVTIDDVLDAERTRLSNRLDLALAQSEHAQAWVQLQVSVGKGWAYSISGGEALETY
ncbi:MAG: efflux transporter outer membrane subunit [Silicimonas sp.]|nr:efflux transporter outer membrane subunit [Silicimonas sp.]